MSRKRHILCALLLSPSVMAQTIVVNPGSSIQSALNSAGAGDTVQVSAGTYTEKISIANKAGSADAFILLKADPGVLLSGSGLTPSGREGLISIENSHYIRVEGFEVANFSHNGTANTPLGILISGYGSNIQIVNNKVHDIRNTSTCKDPCESGAHGIGVFGTHRSGLIDLLFSGNEVYNNVLQASEAFVINGNVDRFEVLNNQVYDNNNIGFDFIGFEGECSGCGENDRARNGVIRGNTARNNTTTRNPWYSNTSSSAGFYVDGGRYLLFDRNISTGNDLGFEFASEHAGKATEDIVMSGNFVYGNRDVGVSLGGYSASVGAARRIYVYNNSFYKNKGWGTEVTFQYKVRNSLLANNIFFGESSAAACYENQGSGHANNTWGQNVWWGTSSTSTGLPGTKVIADPQFVSPTTGDLKILSSSPARDVGTVAANLTTWTSAIWDRYFPPAGDIALNGATDFSGESRIENVIDLGADEYGTSGASETPPIAPSLLSASANSSSQINIAWNDNSSNETGFKIERSLRSGTGFAHVATTPANGTSYTNSGLAASTEYVYRVRASNSAGDSGYTNEASAITQSAATTIVVDGATSDWDSVGALSTNGVGGMTSLKVYSDTSYLYILAQGITSTNYGIFIDTDNSAATGFTDGLWSDEGSDYMLENGVLHKCNGCGAIWNWTSSGVSQAGIQAVKNASVIEVRIPHSSLVGMGATIKIGVDIESGSWVNIGSIPATGSSQASFTR